MVRMPKGQIIVSLYSCILGVLNLIGGASRKSHFYDIDNIVVRVLGLALVIGGIGMLSRRAWSRHFLIISYIVSIVEIFTTYNYTGYSTPYLIFMVIFVGISYVLPTWYLSRHGKSFVQTSND
jgi:hypothetical protein